MDNWNHGNAVHDGHALLGEIALHHGDVETAERHLGQAGESPGSPQLGNHGPNMTLARELLARGQKDAVRGYLEGCRNFGRAGSGAIDPMLRFVETSTLAAIEADEEEARRRAEETREVFHLGGEGSALAEAKRMSFTPEVRSFVAMLHGASVRRTLERARRLGCDQRIESFGGGFGPWESSRGRRSRSHVPPRSPLASIGRS